MNQGMSLEEAELAVIREARGVDGRLEGLRAAGNNRIGVREGKETQQRMQNEYDAYLARRGEQLPDGKKDASITQIENAGAEGFGAAQGELQEWESPLEKANAGYKNERPPTRQPEQDRRYQRVVKQKERGRANTAEVNRVRGEIVDEIKARQKNFDFGINDMDGQFLAEGKREITGKKQPGIRIGRKNINFDLTGRDEAQYFGIQQDKRGNYDYIDPYEGNIYKRIAAGDPPLEPVRGQPQEIVIPDTGRIAIDGAGRVVNNAEGLYKPFIGTNDPGFQNIEEFRQRGVPAGFVFPRNADNSPAARVAPLYENYEGRLVRQHVNNIDGIDYYRHLIESPEDAVNTARPNLPNILGNAPARNADDAMKAILDEAQYGDLDPVEAEKLLRKLEVYAQEPGLKGDNIANEAGIAAADRAMRGGRGELTSGEIEELAMREARRAAPDPLKEKRLATFIPDTENPVRPHTDMRPYVRTLPEYSPNAVNMRTAYGVVPGLAGGAIKIQVPGSAVTNTQYRGVGADRAILGDKQIKIRPGERIRRAEGAVATKYGGPGAAASPSAIADQVRAREAAKSPFAAEKIRRDNANADYARQVRFEDSPAGQQALNNLQAIPGLRDLGKARIGGGVPGDPLNYLLGTEMHDFADAPGFNAIFRDYDAQAEGRIKENAYSPNRYVQLANAENGQLRYLDRGGQQVGSAFDPQGRVNTADSSQTLNAPTGAAGFMARRAYDNYGAQGFGDVEIAQAGAGGGGGLRQVDIQGAIGDVEDQIMRMARGRNAFKDGRPKIRGAADLDNVIAQLKGAKGGKIYGKDEEGKRVFREDPGVTTMLDAVKVPRAKQEALANALIQLELGGGAGFSTGGLRPEAEVVRGVDNPQKGGDNLQIQRAGRDDAARLRAAGISTDAAKPFIGKVVGQRTDPKRNIQAYDGMDPVEVRRYYEDRNRGNREKKVAAAAKRGNQFKPDRQEEVNQLNQIRKAQVGNVVARQNAEGIGNAGLMNVSPRQNGNRLNTRPEFKQNVFGVVEGGANMQNVQVPAGFTPKPMAPRPVQPIAETVVPTSIAPEPGAGTGNQPVPQIDAGRGGALVRMRPSTAAPAQQIAPNGYNVPAEYDVMERYNNPPQYMTAPDQQQSNSSAKRRGEVRRRADNISNIRTRKRAGYGALGAGAAAGLGALISGERDERDQEEMYR